VQKIKQYFTLLLIIITIVGCSGNVNNEVVEGLPDTLASAENPAENADVSATEEVAPLEEAIATSKTPIQPTTESSSTQNACNYQAQYEIWDTTTEVFSEEKLKELGADNFSGTDAEIAQQIYDWQASNMDYAGPMDNFQDAGFGSRWNSMIPGIYPASERLNHVSSEGKIYGICGDFANIFIAIANAYNLEVRETVLSLDKHVEIFGSLPLEVQNEETYRGLGLEEFNLLNVLLQKNNIDLTYDQVHRAIQGISTNKEHNVGMHSRAEVLLDGVWVAFDATRAFLDLSLEDEYDKDENYVLANWQGIYSSTRLYAPAFQDTSAPALPIDFDGLIDYMSCGSQVVYTGITDDFGNENRAVDISGLIKGDALLPYFTDLQKNADFMFMDVSILEEEGYSEYIEDFFDGTGRPFNILADFLIFEDDNMDPEVYVRRYNGITGDTLTLEEFNQYLN
jgi:hypothetical protein